NSNELCSPPLQARTCARLAVRALVEDPEQVGSDSLGCLAVPITWDPPLQLTRNRAVEGLLYGLGVGSDELIGAFVDRYGAFGVRAQRETRHTEDRRFFLDAARIRERQASVGYQRQEVQVPEGLGNEPAFGSQLQPNRLQACACARVNRKHEFLVF